MLHHHASPSSYRVPIHPPHRWAFTLPHALPTATVTSELPFVGFPGPRAIVAVHFFARKARHLHPPLEESQETLAFVQDEKLAWHSWRIRHFFLSAGNEFSRVVLLLLLRSLIVLATTAAETQVHESEFFFQVNTSSLHTPFDIQFLFFIRYCRISPSPYFSGTRNVSPGRLMVVTACAQ
jgi:hypothetical protein